MEKQCIVVDWFSRFSIQFSKQYIMEGLKASVPQNKNESVSYNGCIFVTEVKILWF